MVFTLVSFESELNVFVACVICCSPCWIIVAVCWTVASAWR